MVSKAAAKYIKSLQVKKYRKEAQSFLVEGAKCIGELMHSDLQVPQMLVTASFRDLHTEFFKQYSGQLLVCKEEMLIQVGSLKSNNAGVAVVKMPEHQFLPPLAGTYSLVLDDVRDPGNLGTIMRIADWYGIKSIICSEHCADVYNPKVIMASMGSFTRVAVHYLDIASVLADKERAIIGALLEGENLHNFTFPKQGGYIVLGNESNGIGEAVQPLIQYPVKIPGFGAAESLNVGIAAAIFCDNWRSSSQKQ